jgi:hypothetical protein
VLLENKVESIEALNASLRKSISEQSTKYILNNYDMSKTSDHVNNYANSKPFSTSDDIYIKSSNNIEHSPLRLSNYFAKKETTNDHARTETICQSREVPAEYLGHNNQNNNANQSNYNNNQQQPIPTRITTRKRVKNECRKSNLKRNECKNICTDYCKSNISKPYKQSKIRNGNNGRNNEDFRTESWGRDKIGWFQFYY